MQKVRVSIAWFLPHREQFTTSVARVSVLAAVTLNPTTSFALTAVLHPVVVPLCTSCCVLSAGGADPLILSVVAFGIEPACFRTSMVIEPGWSDCRLQLEIVQEYGLVTYPATPTAGAAPGPSMVMPNVPTSILAERSKLGFPTLPLPLVTATCPATPARV